MPVPILPWPLPDLAPTFLESAQGGLVDNRLSFDADLPMPPIERPMTSWAPEVFSVTLGMMCLEDYQTFQNWYRKDLRYGVHPFKWFHPITGQVSPWKIVKASPPFEVRRVAPEVVIVSFSVMSWPGSFPPGFLEQEEDGLVLQEQDDRIVVADGYTFNG